MATFVISNAKVNMSKLSWFCDFCFGFLGFLKGSDWLDALKLMHNHMTYTPFYSLSHLTYSNVACIPFRKILSPTLFGIE